MSFTATVAPPPPLPLPLPVGAMVVPPFDPCVGVCIPPLPVWSVAVVPPPVFVVVAVEGPHAISATANSSETLCTARL